MLLGRQWRCIGRISLGIILKLYMKSSKVSIKVGLVVFITSEVLESVYILRDITIDGKYSNYNVKH